MRIFIAALALLSTPALAEHPVEEQPNDPSAVAVAGAASVSEASAVASSNIDIAVAPAQVEVSAAGGDGGSAQSDASANNEGVTQVTSIRHQRNAPSLAQGGLAVAGCGAGVNGGGSGQGGAGFLGLVWTTDQCYQLLAAASFATIGMPDTSCDLLVSMKSVQRAFKRAGKPLPDCLSAENRDMATAAAEIAAGLAIIERMKPAPTCTDCATKEELNRAFKKSNEK